MIFFVSETGYRIPNVKFYFAYKNNLHLIQTTCGIRKNINCYIKQVVLQECLVLFQILYKLKDDSDVFFFYQTQGHERLKKYSTMVDIIKFKYFIVENFC